MNVDQTSRTLLGQLKNDGSGSAWLRFNDIYGPLILNWLRRRGVSENAAEDVRQEVMLKLVGEIHKFQHNGRTGAFRSWLKLVMIHRLRTIQRKSYRQGDGNRIDFSQLADQLADDGSEMSRLWDYEHDQVLIDRLLDLVSGDFQKTSMVAFRRVVIQNEDPEVVAAELGITVNAVRIAQSRIMAALRRIGAGFLDS